MNILQLSKYLDELLDIHSIKDSDKAVNGLQVENTGDIKKIGLAVDVCMATIKMAVEKGCDMMFVHHGMFWDGLHPVTGKRFEKLAAMLKGNLGLYSAHIPLDVHPVLGNNRTLADKIGMNNLEPFGEYGGMKIGLKGKIDRQTAKTLGKTLEEKLGAPPMVIGEGDLETVGVVTGGAGDIIRQAIEEKLDCYITGEGANHNFHEAVEGNCVLILAGHYATETGGAQSVGKHLSEKFGIEYEFLDYPTGL
jgi:dinuclear metal center YbgI/SA1388 family protein